jgi:signal transduction histidine kinase
VAVLAGTAQASDVDKSTPGGVAVYLAVLIANVVPMCAFGLLMRRAAVQNDERRRTLAELAEVNRRLAATVAENAALQRRLLERARRDGVHDERARLARELHDTLAQGLVGIVTQLQAAEQAGDDPPAWRRRVTAAIDLARQSLAEARRSVHALRPQPLAGARLAEALAEVTRRWSDLHGVPAEVTVTGTVRPMPPDAEDTLLRTAQEALANVARHAAAGRAGVTLSYLDGEVAVDVRDDGRGFDPADRGGSGFGLVAMGQRIKGLGGTLQVESEPGAGTAISARVPSGGVPSGGEPVGRLPVGRAPVTS